MGDIQLPEYSKIVPSYFFCVFQTPMNRKHTLIVALLAILRQIDFIYIYVCMHVFVCIEIHICVNTFVCMYVCLCSDANIYIYILQ